MRLTPQGSSERQQRSTDAGSFSSRRHVTGGASGVGPPLLSSASSETWPERCLDSATANEHLPIEFLKKG